MTITLSGITWDHPRGYAPLATSIERYKAVRPDVTIEWTTRSLREFGELSLDALATRYDMIVFDHPFVGQAHKLGLLADLTPHIKPEQRKWLDAGALGASWRSYQWKGGIYGLPVDAAAQVAAWRPDLLKAAVWYAPATMAQVFALAEALRARKQYVVLAACPTDAICMLITLLANTGHPPGTDKANFVDPARAEDVLALLRRLIEVAHPDSPSLNPIQALDRMAQGDDMAYMPYTFGYTNYSRPGVKNLIQFGDIVAAGENGPAGALLGGAGIGVTTRCTNPAAAIDYGLWLCNPDYQRTHYLAEGGQPGMMQAWQDPACDAATSGFFNGTLRTLTAAYLRPRHPGFVPFFEQGGEEVNAFLRGKGTARALVSHLNESYRRLVHIEE